MSDNEVKIALLKNELKELNESFKYQYGENYLEHEEVRARLEVIENMIKFYEE